MSLLIERGQRAVIVGATGSGKTVMGIAQIKNYPNAPIYVIDTKGDDGIYHFLTAQLLNKNCVVVESVNDMRKICNLKRGTDYVWVIPSGEELQDAERVDEYLKCIYNAGRPCLTFIDEAYQVHKSGFAYAGLINLLTRGRSKGMSTICCTQRPAWVSRFLFTESDSFFVYRLQSVEDYKKLTDNGIPFITDYFNKNPEAGKRVNMPKYHFYNYRIGSDSGTFYTPINIDFDAGYTKETDKQDKRWV